MPAGRTAAADGRAAVEPPPPTLPRPGRFRPAGLPGTRARRRLHRSALARSVQRRLSPVRPPQDGRGRHAFPLRPARAGRPPRVGSRPDHRGGAAPPALAGYALFYRAVLGMDPELTSEIAAPFGLVRDRTVTAGGVRLVLTASLLRRGEWAPGVSDPQYIAFAAPDALAAARAARAGGAPILDIP